MILMGCKIRVKPSIGVKRLNQITKKAFSDVGAYWHDQMLPDAFAPGAVYRHEHQPRSRKWKNKKLRLASHGIGEEGGTRNLVFTGMTRRSVKEYATIRAFPRRATVNMVGPRYISMQPKNPNMPNMGQEITHLTEGQRQRLMKVFRDTVMQGIRATNTTKTYTVG